ncbi:Uncharacterised protein [uncultured archaeon]|nr:Uncharacterised protein [uncultured archaeon]
MPALPAMACPGAADVPFAFGAGQGSNWQLLLAFLPTAEPPGQSLASIVQAFCSDAHPNEKSSRANSPSANRNFINITANAGADGI